MSKMSDIDEINIQKIIKALQDLLSDETIKYIEVVFKQFNDTLKTFGDYENIVNLYDNLIKIVNILEIEPITHLEKRQTPNTKHDQHLSNEETEQLIFLLSDLRDLASKVFHLKILDFMRYILNTSNTKEILFGNVEFTEERINKRYRKLARYFHPDKTSHLNIHTKLKEEYINICNELFKCVSELRKSLLFDLEKSSRIDLQTFHEENAYQFWIKAVDYRNAYKAQWDKLKFLKIEDLREISSEELGRLSVSNGKSAYEKYRAACKLADKNKLLKSQIKLRGFMALSLHISDQFLEARLYAFTAINMAYKNSNYITRQDLDEANGIFEKVKGDNASGTGNIPQKNTENKPGNSSDNSSFDLVNKETLDELSFYEKKNIYRSSNDFLEKISNEFIVKADMRLVRYQANKEEILHAEKRAFIHKVFGSGVMGAVLGGGLTLVTTGTLSIISTVGTVVGTAVVGTALLYPLLLLSGGIFAVFFGIFGGYFMFKRGKKIYEEPKTREALNNIMKEALTAYINGDYQKFFEELSKEYKNKSSILKINGPADSVNHEAIINALLEHGFRPDGIAYLLILISEVLISGKIKIPRTTPDQLKTEGLKTLHGVLDVAKLKDEAKKLDYRIQKFRKKPFKRIWNRFIDSIKFQEYSSIAQENKDDAKKMTFISRLEEMYNVARINLAVSDIINGGPIEIERAKEFIEQVWKSTYFTQFFSIFETRLEALEDLFWVVSGYELDKPFFIKN